jgi:transcriptional regulator with XRE-family HTH domain
MSTTIQVSKKLHARVDKAARALGVTVPSFVARALEERLRLQSTKQAVKLPSMLQARRVRVSQGGRDGQEHDALVLAANAAHHTLRSLAEAVGCTAAALTQARHGDTSISLERAKQIESISGFKATHGNWPRIRDAETRTTKGRKDHGRKTKNPRPRK